MKREETDKVFQNVVQRGYAMNSDLFHKAVNQIIEDKIEQFPTTLKEQGLQLNSTRNDLCHECKAEMKAEIIKILRK